MRLDLGGLGVGMKGGGCKGKGNGRRSKFSGDMEFLYRFSWGLGTSTLGVLLDVETLSESTLWYL